jgi:hypothetical protein
VSRRRLQRLGTASRIEDGPRDRCSSVLHRPYPVRTPRTGRPTRWHDRECLGWNRAYPSGICLSPAWRGR